MKLLNPEPPAAPEPACYSKKIYKALLRQSAGR